MPLVPRNQQLKHASDTDLPITNATANLGGDASSSGRHKNAARRKVRTTASAFCRQVTVFFVLFAFVWISLFGMIVSHFFLPEQHQQQSNIQLRLPSTRFVSEEPRNPQQNQKLRDMTATANIPRAKQHTNTTTIDSMIDMRDLNARLRFDNPDGGVWKQGWNVAPRGGDLSVIVVPHSHCDPGWIKTFDAYFQNQVKQILTTVVEALVADKRRAFVWAEISYFAWWWDEQAEPRRQQVRDLLRSGQLEFVTGGWVQPDEANSELYAMEIQLQEGHDWIRAELGPEFVPKYGWAIDPFGYSPTMAYLLNKYGFNGMLIQRVHYAIKKELALHKQLEFNWRQTWDDKGAHDIFTHVMPFYSYDVPHTCGPDPSVCCQFDFHRSPVGQGSGCPWNKPPVAINDDNVRERAELLLDQYRKKAALYRTDVVLVPLGDDFRYETPVEAELQYCNHQKIHDYINQHITGVSVKFGTLSQYFEAVIGKFDAPTLKGSFFTYADVNQDYWSGYFTSRVFDKALDRQLERVLYAAEAMGGTKLELREPRRQLSLFQHHDGITGTAKSHVVDDYAKRMHDSIRFTQAWLLSHLKESFPQEVSIVGDLLPCWVSDAPRGLSQNQCGDHGSIVIYNPLEVPQTCGTVSVPSKQARTATLPCEVPGIAAGSSTRLEFDPKTGLMTYPFREEWRRWMVTQGGAYLFFPGRLELYDMTDVKIQDGGYVVETSKWKRTIVEKKVGANAIAFDFIYETFLEADNEEWFVRFHRAGLENGGVFHTDLNGFNFDTHHFRADLPIQSQVFPMPTLASIEDASHRMTIISEHAQGAASLETGSVDIWLDRRLLQDDNRGVGQGVQDNRPTRTRLRVLLESEGYTVAGEFKITQLCRLVWDELQHPLEMFGQHILGQSPASEEMLAKAAANREAIRKGRRNEMRYLNDTNENKLAGSQGGLFNGVSKMTNNVSGFVLNPAGVVSQPTIPFVFMVHKRLDYLQKAIDSLRRSDFPKHVPLIVSHDGRVPEVVQYVASLRSEFNLIQLFHPSSCFEHPNAFPGDDPKLNEGFHGDTYGNKRSAWATCCKHHFTWMLKTVFDELDLHDSDGHLVDTFMFLEEDYIVAATIYSAIINGLKVMKQYEHTTNGGFFGLVFDPTHGSTRSEKLWLSESSWIAESFRSGPMTMNRAVFKKFKENAVHYCRFDDYNWDWSLVHMQGAGHLPHTILNPSRMLVKHIGVIGGMHSKDIKPGALVGSSLDKLDTNFSGTLLYGDSANVKPFLHNAGFGGWAHLADQEHCMQLLGASV
jgi:hypothetical protein